MINLIYDLLQNENEVEFIIKNKKFIAFNEESEIFKSLIQECENSDKKIYMFDNIAIVGYKNDYREKYETFTEALNFALRKTENYFERGFINPLSGKFNKINKVLFYYKEI